MGSAIDSRILALALIGVLGLLAALIFTPIAARLGRRAGLIDRPRPGELQRQPVARSGGYAVLAAFVVAVVASIPLFPRDGGEAMRLTGLAVGSIIILPIAIVDDWKRLGPLPQLVGQIMVAIVGMFFGLTINTVASPFGGLYYLPVVIALPFTFVWIVGMINTINFIDTMDGVATGITAIAALVLVFRSVSQGQYSIAALALALAGAALGFLWFNFNPARVYLGTSGSMFLGYALAVLAIIGGAKIATAAMVLGLPIIDVALVIAERSARGRSPFVGGDGAHLPHRLIALGWRPRSIALLIYAGCAFGGTLALVLDRMEKLVVFIAVLIVAVLIGWRRRASALHTKPPNLERV